MPRKNIFESIKDNYNPNKEIEKIYDNLRHYDIFCRFQVDQSTGEEVVVYHYNFFEFCNLYLFKYFPEKGTCRTIEEFIEYADAELKFGRNFNLTVDKIINFIEVVENALHIYFNDYRYFRIKYGLDYYNDCYEETRFLIDEIEKHLGLTKLEFEDRIILYEDNPKLNQSLNNVPKPELAIELIKYRKGTSSSIEKRKILKQLDILTEPINDRIKKKYSVAKDLDCIFNNFQLRHNNTDPNSNDYKENVAQLSETELCEIYDTAYELILDTLMLDEYDTTIAKRVNKYKSYL